MIVRPSSARDLSTVNTEAARKASRPDVGYICSRDQQGLKMTMDSASRHSSSSNSMRGSVKLYIAMDTRLFSLPLIPFISSLPTGLSTQPLSPNFSGSSSARLFFAATLMNGERRILAANIHVSLTVNDGIRTSSSCTTKDVTDLGTLAADDRVIQCKRVRSFVL